MTLISQYGLTSQIQRAAVSILSNLSSGFVNRIGYLDGQSSGQSSQVLNQELAMLGKELNVQLQ